MVSQVIKIISVITLSAAMAYGATVTFTPVSATTVTPGTQVTYQLQIAVETLLGISTADVIIGSTDATDIAFVYDAAWTSAFSNTTTPAFDVGFYNQDVFVGGNNATSVGSTLVLGTITINTTAMPEGSFTVQVNSTIDGELSSLTFSGNQEFLNGSAMFAVQCASTDGNCDGKVDAEDYRTMATCMQGPGQPFLTGCGAYDTDLDGDVDAVDFSVLALQYTGS